MAEKEKKTSGFGTASLVLGIIGIVFSLIPIISYVSYVLGVLAIIFGILSLCKKSSVAMSIVGIVLSIFALIMANNYHQALKSGVNEIQNVISSGVDEIQNTITVDNDSETAMTLEKFNKIQTGMTYQQVVDIVGSEGTLDSESSYGGYTMQSYHWYASNGISNAVISFDNGKVSGKTQIGLD